MVIRGQTDGVTLREMGEMNVFGVTACARAGGLGGSDAIKELTERWKSQHSRIHSRLHSGPETSLRNLDVFG